MKLKWLRVFVAMTFCTLSLIVTNAQTINLGEELSSNPEYVSVVETHGLNTPELFMVTGQVRDSQTGIGLSNFRIRIEGEHDAIITTKTDMEGNYLIVADRRKIDFPITLQTKKAGYEKLVLTNISTDADQLEIEINLNASKRKMVRANNLDSPYNVTVYKF